MFPISIIIVLVLLAVVAAIWGSFRLILSLVRKNKNDFGSNLGWLSHEDVALQIFAFLGLMFFWILLSKLNLLLANPLQGYYILLILAAVCFAIAYGLRILSAALMGVFVLFFGVLWHLFDGIYEVPMIASMGAIVFLALAFYLLGRWHDTNEKDRRLAKIYLLFGIIISILSLFIFSIREIRFISVSLFESNPVSLVYFALFFGAVLLIAFWDLKGKKLMPVEFLFLAAIFLFVTIAALLGVSEGYIFIFNFIANLLLLGASVGTLLLGYFKREDWYINFGTVLVILTVMIKYFDWFSFLDKSIYFIGAGATFFLLGMLLDKTRKAMLANIKQQSNLQ